MTGPLRHPTKADFSPDGALPHESAMRHRARAHFDAGAPARPARFKRIFNGWMAAANAYRERQAALFASDRASGAKLDNKRVYHGPIDDALEKAARLRRRRKQSLN